MCFFWGAVAVLATVFLTLCWLFFSMFGDKTPMDDDAYLDLFYRQDRNKDEP